MPIYDSDSDNSIDGSSTHRNGATNKTTTPRKPNVCTTVMSAIMGNQYMSDSQRQWETEQEQQKECEKVAQYINFHVPYAKVEKAMLLQESQLFHDPYPPPLFCLAVLGRLSRLLAGCGKQQQQQQLKWTEEEVTDLFFGLTKLFSSSTIASPMDQYVRRMVYWLLNEFTSLSKPEERMMLLSCLTKDMTDQFTPPLRARALRLLPCILLRPQPTQQQQQQQQDGPRSSVTTKLQNLSQTIAATKTISTTLPCSLNPNLMAVTARVMSSALVALTRLLQHEQSAQLISSDDEESLQKQVYALALATGAKQRDLSMVQFHAIQTAMALDQKEQRQYTYSSNGLEGQHMYNPSSGVIQLMGDIIQGDFLMRTSPLTLVVLIRHTQRILSSLKEEEEEPKTNGDKGSATNKNSHKSNICATHYHFFLQSCLVNPSPMVVLETARVVIDLAPQHVPLDMMEKTVAVLNRIQKTTTTQSKTAARVAKGLLEQVGQKLVKTL